jgi:hypothetical protein
MEEITEEKRRAALLAGQRLVHAGHGPESTYARLEKELAKSLQNRSSTTYIIMLKTSTRSRQRLITQQA